MNPIQVVHRPSLSQVVHGMRQLAWLGAANPQVVATVNRRLSKARAGSMQQAAWVGVSDPRHGALEIRRLVEVICKDLQPGDYAGEILAVYYWVCQNIRYMRDPLEIELVKEPIVILRTGAADCEELAVLLAAMLMSCGNECRFVLIGFESDHMPSHAFCAVKTPAGFMALDPVANRVTNGMWDRATFIQQIPCGPGA